MWRGWRPAAEDGSEEVGECPHMLLTPYICLPSTNNLSYCAMGHGWVKHVRRVSGELSSSRRDLTKVGKLSRPLCRRNSPIRPGHTCNRPWIKPPTSKGIGLAWLALSAGSPTSCRDTLTATVFRSINPRPTTCRHAVRSIPSTMLRKGELLQ